MSQLFFGWNRYPPYDLFFAQEELEWPCKNCGKKVVLYNALIETDHLGIYCRKCQVFIDQHNEEFWDMYWKNDSEIK